MTFKSGWTWLALIAFWIFFILVSLDGLLWHLA
jgi:hypothetical protein